MVENARHIGTVDWWSNHNGWGAINIKGGPQGIFVHFAEIEGAPFANLRCGEQVEFNLEENRQGRGNHTFRAYAVKSLGLTSGRASRRLQRR